MARAFCFANRNPPRGVPVIETLCLTNCRSMLYCICSYERITLTTKKGKNMSSINRWTYHWYDPEKGVHYSHDFVTGNWLRNGIIEPTNTFASHRISRLSDQAFLDMMDEYYNHFSPKKKTRSSSSKKSSPKASKKIGKLMKRKRK